MHKTVSQPSIILSTVLGLMTPSFTGAATFAQFRGLEAPKQFLAEEDFATEPKCKTERFYYVDPVLGQFDFVWGQAKKRFRIGIKPQTA